MYCTKCGAPIMDNTKFCTRCGERVVMNTQTTAAFDRADTGESNGMHQERSSMPATTKYGYYGQGFTNGSAYPYGQTQQSGAKVCRCKNCKTVFQGQIICPNCRSNDIDFKPDLYMGILALVFGVLGGYLGILFGIMGIHSAKQTGYKALKVMCVIAIPLCIISSFTWTILGSVIASEF